MCINNTSHLIYPIKRSNNRKLFIGNTKFTLGRTKIANFNSAKTFKIANSQTLISANISSFTVLTCSPLPLQGPTKCASPCPEYKCRCTDARSGHIFAARDSSIGHNAERLYAGSTGGASTSTERHYAASGRCAYAQSGHIIHFLVHAWLLVSCLGPSATNFYILSLSYLGRRCIFLTWVGLLIY